MQMFRVIDLYDQCEGHGEFWGMTVLNHKEMK